MLGFFRSTVVTLAAILFTACGPEAASDVGGATLEHIGSAALPQCDENGCPEDPDPCVSDPESCEAPPPPPPPATTWHVSNGGFESLGSGEFPMSWSRGTTSAQYVYATPNAYSGSVALYLEGYWSWDAAAPYVVSSPSSTPTTSAPYALSLMAATNLNCNPCALISVQWMAGDSVIQYDNFSLPPNGGGWAPYSFAGTKPSQADCVRVRVEANDITHSGVRIDDVALRLN